MMKMLWTLHLKTNTLTWNATCYPDLISTIYFRVFNELKCPTLGRQVKTILYNLKDLSSITLVKNSLLSKKKVAGFL